MPIELTDIPAAVADYLDTQVTTAVSRATPKAHATIAGYGALSVCPSPAPRPARVRPALPVAECHEF